MREIKFRVWNKTIYQDRLEYTVISLNNTGWININSETNGGIDMFTGLKDKNGVEIYEGDILNVIAHLGVESFTVKVEWDSNLARFFTGNSPLSAYAKQSEIIGNIYQNTELLN